MKGIISQELMTTKEVAESLGCSVDVITNACKRIFPNKMVKGKKTFFNESEVTIMLEELKKNKTVLERTSEVTSEVIRNTTTALTPALRIKNAMLEMQSAYEEELANLKAQNIEVVEENGQLRLQVSKLSTENKKLEHALEYDKVKDWNRWKAIKKDLKYKGNFSKVACELNLVDGEDFERKVMGNDKYPTIMISPEATELIFTEYQDW